MSSTFFFLLQRPAPEPAIPPAFGKLQMELPTSHNGTSGESARFRLSGKRVYQALGNWVAINLVPNSLWSILAAPLLAGNDLRNISLAFLAILTNREVIAVNQDKDGKQGRRLSKSGDAEVWTRPLSDGAQAIAFFNRCAEAAKITFKMYALSPELIFPHSGLKYGHPGTP